MRELYKSPRHYEIAFSFRDIVAEVDLFEECFRRFSRIPVRSVLELACGNSPHMEELVNRGYGYAGLDLSEAMLDYSRQKAAASGCRAELIHGNMIDFSLGAPVDFVYVLLGSMFVKSTSELLTHLASVGRALRGGGLYFLDWCIEYPPMRDWDKGSTWQIERDGVRVKATVKWEPISRADQTFAEVITLDVSDRGTRSRIRGRDERRAIYPQEFLCLVDRDPCFEFVGWWNHWDLSQPLGQAHTINRPIALLRRT